MVLKKCEKLSRHLGISDDIEFTGLIKRAFASTTSIIIFFEHHKYR